MNFILCKLENDSLVPAGASVATSYKLDRDGMIRQCEKLIADSAEWYGIYIGAVLVMDGGQAIYQHGFDLAEKLITSYQRESSASDRQPESMGARVAALRLYARANPHNADVRKLLSAIYS